MAVRAPKNATDQTTIHCQTWALSLSFGAALAGIVAGMRIQARK